MARPINEQPGVDGCTEGLPVSATGIGEVQQAEQAELRDALKAAFSALIATTGGHDEPPTPPGLDELHETFLLLNAEHRAFSEEEATAAREPILAF
jgi:hypothetical protein